MLILYSHILTNADGFYVTPPNIGHSTCEGASKDTGITASECGPVSGSNRISHSLCMLVGSAIEVQWDSISLPSDIGGRPTRGGAGQRLLTKGQAVHSRGAWSIRTEI